MDAEESVSVTAASNGKFDVKVDTVTTNAHMCNFEAQGSFLKGKVILTEAPSQFWDGAKEIPAACHLAVKFLDANTVKVITNGTPCDSFCGMNASLEIESAKRK